MTLRALVFALAAVLATAQSGPGPVTPLPPLPSRAQLAWQRMEMNAFVHFGPNTFTSVEWGSGREDPAVFHPTDFDARQWVRAFKDAGFKGVILTAKHHDGFCLWPSAQSSHTVARSSWQGGHGDVVRDVADACREAGLKFGVYLSPWDRNHPAYGTPEYNAVFVRMLEEVLGRYGPVFEVWFDGANGEGPNGKRQVYDWPLFVSTVRRLQPEAVIFSDAGPDVRWVGNERGEGSLTSWSLVDRARYVPGTPFSDELGEGTLLGADWVAPECDVSIRPGWFYRSTEDARVKSADTLLGLYEQSVGRNCQLLLNVPPDTRGRIADADLQALAGMGAGLDRRYGANRAKPATLALDSGVVGSAAVLLDGDPDTYWSAPAGATTPRLTLTVPAPITFDRVVLQEPIALGQRIAAFEVEAEQGGAWHRIATGTTVGGKRILPVPPTRTARVRVTIHSARSTPLLSEVAFY
jgi:alpha-L-fucosidase